jgi:hypothetical protein
MKINEIRTETVEEFQKSLAIRIIDIFVIAPICVYAGLKGKTLPKFIQLSLIVIGVSTFYYNGKNYLKNKNN